ncbi:MAG: iron chelate uptake ABC transporter family permease subunit, partial [Deltaproteobacteria bacterium]|nr:iron chelate uptake ABC transporter family permease subunit [Deltaproteobacteria bacterium]
MKRHVFLLLILTPLAVFIVSLFVGRYPIAPGRVLEILAYAFAPGPGEPDTAHYVFFGVRLPRILLAMMVGAGLSISGSA